jgi:hypothetical protein
MKQRKRATGFQPKSIRVTVGGVVKEYVLVKDLLVNRSSVIKDVRELHSKALRLSSAPPRSHETEVKSSSQDDSHPCPFVDELANIEELFRSLESEQYDVFPVDLIL